jgi:uncharacterized alkaline shock family protein YloU
MPGRIIVAPRAIASLVVAALNDWRHVVRRVAPQTLPPQSNGLAWEETRRGVAVQLLADGVKVGVFVQMASGSALQETTNAVREQIRQTLGTALGPLVPTIDIYYQGSFIPDAVSPGQATT